MVGLRIVSVDVAGADLGALAALVLPLAPDAVVVRGGPRRLRWRTRCADLANRLHLVHGAGGEPSLGNLVLLSLRVTVREEWAVQYPLTPGRRMRGAVLASCAVAGAGFVLGGTRLAADERVAQAAVLHRTMSQVDGPLIVVADAAEEAGGPATRLLAEGRTAVPAGGPVIVVGGGARVRDWRGLGGVAGAPPAVLVELDLPPSPAPDPASMVSGRTSH